MSDNQTPNGFNEWAADASYQYAAETILSSGVITTPAQLVFHPKFKALSEAFEAGARAALAELQEDGEQP